MNAFATILLCGALGSAMGYYAQPQFNNPYVDVNSNFNPEPSQRLFWGNGQGTNQVGGTGLWAHFTNKFPFLNNMFGRLEMPENYSNQPSTQYGVPQFQTPQLYQAPQTYQVPQTYQAPQAYLAPQTYQVPQAYQPQVYQIPQYRQNFVPLRRDVGFTDDSIIVTPPQVPIGPVAPQPAPIAPQPAPEPTPEGYNYNKPQYRLELPHK